MRENVFSVTRSMVSLSPYRGKKISETEGLSEGIKAGFFCRGGERSKGRKKAMRSQISSQEEQRGILPFRTIIMAERRWSVRPLVPDMAEHYPLLFGHQESS